MTLSRQSWWHHAEHLQVGQQRRVPHDCGDGSPLLVSRSHEDGYRGWCFRCLDGDGFRPAESLADKVQRLEQHRAGDSTLPSSGSTLPGGGLRDIRSWPNDARVWLYRAGLADGDIGKLGFYYHPGSDRVVLPGGHPDLGYYQARAYQPGRMPKYIGPTPKPARLLVRFGEAEVPTLTEDILSAAKIGLVSEGWAVLGTSVSSHMVAALMKRGRCNVALDPDAAGRRGAAKIVKQLRAYGLTVRNVEFQRDPKLMPRESLRRVLVEGCEPHEVA